MGIASCGLLYYSLPLCLSPRLILAILQLFGVYHLVASCQLQELCRAGHVLAIYL